MLVSFLVVVSSYLSHTIALVFGFVDTLLINFMIGVAKAIEFLPFSYFALTISFSVMCLMYVFILMLMKFILLRRRNETRVTVEGGNLTDIISY